MRKAALGRLPARPLVSAVDVARTDAVEAGDAAPTMWTNGLFSLLATDFQSVYQVNIAAAAERLSMLRFALSLLAAPSLTSWLHVPVYLFALMTVFGVLAVLPYLRMIEASIAHARTARAVNNFRLLYAQQLREKFAALGWAPNLPVDPCYPDSFAPLSWPWINAIALAVLDAAYLTVGLVGLARVQPSPVLIA